MKMTKKPLIKICGITDVETALAAVHLGADFIGLVFDPNSPRYVGLYNAKDITQALKTTQARAVAVSVDNDPNEIRTICDFAEIDVVQCHGDRPRRIQTDFPPDITRIYVLPVKKNGHVTISDLTLSFAELDSARDWYLFDTTTPGSGTAFDWETFKKTPHLQHGFRWALAGGLNAHNVGRALTLNPNMVDVSSGVESSPGVKDIARIREFVQAVKQGAHNDAVI